MGDPLPGPDVERPDEWFLDDGRIVEVAVFPAMMPILMTQGTAYGFVALLFEGMAALLGTRRDPRFKVVVSSRPVRRATMFHAVQVEFFESYDDAIDRQREIVRQWVPGQYADAVPMTSRELRRARLATLRGVQPSPAGTLADFSLTRMRARFSLASGASMLVAGLLVVCLKTVVWPSESSYADSRLLAGGYLAAAVGVLFLLLGVVLATVDRFSRPGVDRSEKHAAPWD